MSELELEIKKAEKSTELVELEVSSLVSFSDAEKTKMTINNFYEEQVKVLEEKDFSLAADDEFEEISSKIALFNNCLKEMPKILKEKRAEITENFDKCVGFYDEFLVPRLKKLSEKKIKEVKDRVERRLIAWRIERLEALKNHGIADDENTSHYLNTFCKVEAIKDIPATKKAKDEIINKIANEIFEINAFVENFNREVAEFVKDEKIDKDFTYYKNKIIFGDIVKNGKDFYSLALSNAEKEHLKLKVRAQELLEKQRKAEVVAPSPAPATAPAPILEKKAEVVEVEVAVAPSKIAPTGFVRRKIDLSKLEKVVEKAVLDITDDRNPVISIKFEIEFDTSSKFSENELKENFTEYLVKTLKTLKI